jgi:putative nucleotidyltransferase with HDIG domain
MLRGGAGLGLGDRWRTPLAWLSAVVSVAAGGVVIVLSRPDPVNTLSAVFGIAAIGAGLTVALDQEGNSVTGSFIVIVLAAAFLGPASAAVAAIIAELTAAVMVKTRWRTVVLTNLPTAVIAPVLAAAVIRGLSSVPSDSAGFYIAVAAGGATVLLVSFAMSALLRRLVYPSEPQLGLDTMMTFLPTEALTILVAVAGVSIKFKLGNGGIAFALAAVFAFSYMAHLLNQSRHRAQQYVSLSWGVLAGLMRSLDIRDQRAARHSAAVARFAQDIAQAVGMSEAECELAHTAGLLHDIGRFALSDRVAERGRTLTEEDWVAIQRHPELGADVLRDLGMYGPVAEIVLAHHERIDGRGYPAGLGEGDIPEIAKIISVAEVYDTLTASDTYRTQMSSFEALNELRRVAGSQVDAHYVEVLAGLLSGEGVEYRHADMADFDAELDMERRINQAGAGG